MGEDLQHGAWYYRRYLHEIGIASVQIFFSMYLVRVMLLEIFARPDIILGDLGGGKRVAQGGKESLDRPQDAHAPH